MATGSNARKSSAGGGKGRTSGSAQRSSTKGKKQSTGSNKKTNNSYKNVDRRSENEGIYDEVILLVTIAVCAIMLLSNFKLMGSFGQKLSGVMYGLFGVMSYIFPVVLFLSAAFCLSNKGNPVAKIKVVAAIVLIITLCSFSQLIAYSDAPAESLADYYTLCSDNRTGGGFFGGLITHPLYGGGKGIGLIGTYVVLVILLIISLVLITEKSFFGGMKKSTEVIYHTAREDVNRRREIHKERTLNADIMRRERIAKLEEEREKSRMLRTDHKVSGVMMADPLSGVKEAGNVNPVGGAEAVPAHNVKNEHNITINHEPVYDYKSVPLDLDVVNEAMKDKNASAAVNDAVISPAEDRRTGMFSRRSRLKNDDMHEIIYNGDAEEEDIKASLPFGEGVPLFEDDAKNNTKVERHGIYDSLSHSHPINVSGESDLEEAVSDNDREAYERDIAEAAKDINIRIAPAVPGNKEVRTDAGSKSDSAGASGVSEHKKKEIIKSATKRSDEYVFPPLELLNPGNSKQEGNIKELQEMSVRLETTLKNFGINVSMTDVIQGPTVTRYEMKPAQGVKVSKITNLADDICLNMEAKSVRIEAPIPGKAAVGIEIPNKKTMSIMFRDLIDTDEFRNNQSKLTFAVGKDIGGDVICADIAKMPHLLIAGATGSGKSVCINTLIMSILYKARPDEVKLIMVDPKVVELSVYNGIPHLMIPVVTDPKKAAAALNWGVSEMMDRYAKFAEFGVRDLKGYNKKVETLFNDPDIAEDDRPEKMPQIVIIVDELADLMMVASKEVEGSICRLAQLARAAGIHLVIATQRPSVDVITGLIKANMPSRVAFRVSSGIDSRTILDMIGAEKLLGNGDMLFYPQGYSKPARLQGAFVSDKEVADVVEFLKKQSGGNSYNADVEAKIAAAGTTSGAINPSADGASLSDRDELFVEAGRFVIDTDKASIGALQRRFKIGFNRAARIMDQLAEDGVVSDGDGTKARTALMSMEQFETFVEEEV